MRASRASARTGRTPTAVSALPTAPLVLGPLLDAAGAGFKIGDRTDEAEIRDLLDKSAFLVREADGKIVVVGTANASSAAFVSLREQGADDED